ncbi:MAG: YceI family protein [Bacteroidota bacterium]
MANSNWILDKSRSNLRFKVKHLLVASVQGEFKDFDISVSRNGKSFSDVEIKLEIKTDSINTRLKKRDDHLKSRDFLDSEDFPVMSFESTGVSEYKENGYKISGNLTIKEVTKELTIYAQLERSQDYEVFGNLAIEANISREEFGIQWNNLVDEKWPLVDDTIKLYGNICLLRDFKIDKVQGLAGRADIYGNNNYQVYSAKSGKQNGSFAWFQLRSDTSHWIFGNCTGDSEETHYRSLKTKLYVENLAKEYEHIISPSQFLRILHFAVQDDSFLTKSSYDNNTYSLDCSYFMIDKKVKKIKYSSARLTVLLLKNSGLKLYPKNNISMGFPYYNIGQLEDHSFSYESGDTLVVFNEELIRQNGGAGGKKLGAKSVANLLSENKLKDWGNKTKHIEKVLAKWVGEGTLDDIIVAQVKL